MAVRPQLVLVTTVRPAELSSARITAGVQLPVVADFPASARFAFTVAGSTDEHLGLEPGESWWAYVRRPGGSSDAPTVRATASGSG